jgi:hypothetical protein
MRRVSLTLIAFVVVVVVLLGARYQWARAHRPRTAETTAQRDSLRRDTTRTSAEPADTMCMAHRLGFPCDPF